MKIEDLLNDVRKTKTKQAEAAKKVKKADDPAVASQIPQNLTASLENELPKNIVADAQQGDQQKVLDLLDAIEQGGEVSGATGAAENLTEAKIAEEMAILDQAIIDKQAEYFGIKMAESFVSRVVELNNPLVSEKEASEYAKAAAEEEYGRWFNAGQALFDGYRYKAAQFPAVEGSEGILDNGAQLVPATVNQSEVDTFAEDLANYLSSENAMEEEGSSDEGKTAAEKAANVSALFGKIKAFLGGMPSKMVDMGRGTGGAMKSVGTVIRKHPAIAGAATAGAGAAGAGAYMLTNKQPKQSEKISADAKSIIAAFTGGVIDKKQAAEKLLPLLR